MGLGLGFGVGVGLRTGVRGEGWSGWVPLSTADAVEQSTGLIAVVARLGVRLHPHEEAWGGR